MAVKDYDVAAAFQAIEYELINSFFRNMKKHKVDEVKEQKEWEMWQVKQLQELDLYKKRNAEKYGTKFTDINKTIAEMIRLSNEEGQMDQEAEILSAMEKGLKPQRAPEQMTAQFFRTNDRKLDTLINATVSDMERAEVAVLRKADDVYRKTIFNAMVYANTGAGTYEKAIDMATKDFMKAGLTCVEYKNGSKHTISDYADMAVRTANKRAYLQGEGAKRQEWGIHTVIVNKRLMACPHCMPFAGKVFIDDVWGGGTAADGDYPLLSEAVGITGKPKKYTKAEVKEAEKAEEQERKADYAERQAEKKQREASTRLDQDNRLAEQHKANMWKEEAAPFTPAKTIEEAQEYAQKFCKKSFMDRTFKGQVNFKGISLEHANAINRSLTEAYTRFPDMEKLSGIKTVAPGSAQGKKAFKSGADALFSYSPIEHGIFINKDVLKNPKTLDAYMQRSQDAWDLVMNNIDKLSGKQRELAEIYSNAGRELVSGDTVEGLFTHELGHHVQWTMLNPKTTNSITSRMSRYAPRLSGYANASKSEYLAESFAAYMRGEKDILDPEYVEFLSEKRLGRIADKTNSLDNASLEYVMDFKAVHEDLLYTTMYNEYDPWVDMLTEEEIQAIMKYTENDTQETWPKFYEKLNTMLRGDAPYDERLQHYADLISQALKKKPLENDIICTRRVKINPFKGYREGDIALIKQFFSTSLFEEATLSGEYEITLFVRRGVRGAFLNERVSRHPEQLEFLIDKDCEYMIESINGKRIIVEVIPS